MYEFKAQDAFDFARHIGAKAYEHNDELFFRVCPYCNPRAVRDNLKSFSINLTTGLFKCLRASCGVHGNMITLARDFDFSLGNEVDEYYKPKRKFKQIKTPAKPIEPKPEAIEYLTGRGISEEVIKKYQITVQTNHPSVLVFPFFDENGKLQFVKYRKTDYDKSRDANKEWCEANTKPILFGMYQCNTKFDKLVMTEGQMDSLSVATAGYENVVSVPNGAKGFTWVPYCWDWISKFEKIIVFGDFEKGQISLLEELRKRLPGKVEHVREKNYKDCKDANDILRKYGIEQIKVCIENPATIPVHKVIELADVKDVDIYNLEKLETGIRQLDTLLYGGLPFGGVVIISGKSGEGKSTLASQIMANAIEQKYCCFAYSGELPNYLFRAWIDLQIAGPDRISEYEGKFGNRFYRVSSTNKKLIEEWYRGKFYLYDNSEIDGDEKESLCKTVEKVIVQYGVRVILLDNLMTAIDLEETLGSDKYERQSQFVKKLARIGLTYDVLILLVAHKRKNAFSKNENDEVSGSGDITNLALLTIAYEKNKDIDEDKRLLIVSKNRLFGKVNPKGDIVDYDEKSKRIYGHGDDVHRQYSWDKDFDGFIPIEQMEVPF